MTSFRPRVSLTVAAVAGVFALALALPAFAESFLNQHVRITRSTGSKVVGEVIAEDEETITLKTGKGGNSSAIERADIQDMVSIEKLWQEIEKKRKAAKTGEDWYQIGLILEKEGFDKGFVRETFDQAWKVDPGHVLARKRAGFVDRKNDRGETIWLTKAQAKVFDETKGKIVKMAEDMGDRPWDENKIVVRKPDDQPIYEVITNCPKDVAEGYANFMVKLREELVKLIEPIAKLAGQKITWQKNPCKTCNGSGKEGSAKCSVCGGRAEEPCKLFITNSHKAFMDITGSPEGMGGYYRPGSFPPGYDDVKGRECERPIVTFHGVFGTGNTYMVLAHEGTHQLEHLMWKGDERSLFFRPGWLTEGMAVFFGDGLQMKQGKKGEMQFEVGVARDRLAALRRQLKQGAGKYYPLKQFTSFGIPEYQQDPGLYAYGWSLIYYMLNTKDKFKFGGKEIDLREAFGRFFMANCEKGAIEEYGRPACMGLVKALGIENPKDGEAALDALEKVWREYILDDKKVTLSLVGEFDKTDKKKFVSKELGFEFSLPGGPKKPSKVKWDLVAAENLNSTIFDEAAAFVDPSGQARAIVCVMGNAEGRDLEDSLDFVHKRLHQRNYTSYKELGEPVEGTLGGSGIETRLLEFEAKERKIPGYVENPRTTEQRGRMLIAVTAARIYTMTIKADKDAWGTFEAELNEILKSFSVTGGS